MLGMAMADAKHAQVSQAMALVMSLSFQAGHGVATRLHIEMKRPSAKRHRLAQS